MDELRRIYADKRVGERFEFGRCPQGADGGIKPIVWRVLRRTFRSASLRRPWQLLKREKDHLLVIAEQGLDSRPYNERYGGVTWAACSLRRWLNDEFCLQSFSEQERGLILRTRIANNAGPDTEDRVFLLSVNEAESLFADNADRLTVPTDWTVKNGVRWDDDTGCCWWWLRSRGCNHLHASDVDTEGFVIGTGDGTAYANRAVRPVMKLAL